MEQSMPIRTTTAAVNAAKKRGMRIVRALNNDDWLVSGLKESVKMAKQGKLKSNVLLIPVDMPVGVKQNAETGEWVLPRSPGECVDLLYRAREARLAAQRHLERLEQLERQLKEHFVNTLPASDATGLSGAVARVQIKPEIIPVVEDWDKFYAYVRRTSSFELLQRRLTDSAISERWEQRKEVPGVGRFKVKKVSVTKL